MLNHEDYAQYFEEIKRQTSKSLSIDNVDYNEITASFQYTQWIGWDSNNKKHFNLSVGKEKYIKLKRRDGDEYYTRDETDEHYINVSISGTNTEGFRKSIRVADHLNNKSGLVNFILNFMKENIYSHNCEEFLIQDFNEKKEKIREMERSLCAMKKSIGEDCKS